MYPIAYAPDTLLTLNSSLWDKEPPQGAEESIDTLPKGGFVVMIRLSGVSSVLLAPPRPPVSCTYYEV